MIPRRSLAPIALLLAAGAARAQCPFIDFEDRPVGTAITTQYPGVRFSGAGVFGCAPGAAVFRITTVPGATSPTQALATDPQFCRDGLAMVFDAPQKNVTFNASILIGGTLGSTQNLTIRAFDSASGGALLSTQVVAVPVGWGTTSVGNIFRAITVDNRTDCKIRRIEVLPPDNIQIAIDDLRWGYDNTAPTVRIDDPPYQFCVCGTTMTIKGISCDPDGCVYTDRLEMRPVLAAPGTPWTLVGTRSGSVCSASTLYTVNVSSLSGLYYVRLTGTNGCGVSDNDVTVVNVDRTAPTIVVRCPDPGQILSSPIVLDGTVDDFCGVSYTVGYRPSIASPPPFAPVNPATPVYSPGVINDPLASWVTASGPTAVADGPYDIRVTATDGCGNTSALTRSIVVDNTPPVAVITSPLPCRNVCGIVPVIGTASDANLAGWTLDYIGFGGSQASWTNIASGTTSIVNNVIANWDTSSLPRCAYVLRLTVDDKANGGCTGRIPNRSIWYQVVSVGAYANCDASTTPPVLNSGDFACFLARFRAEGSCPQ